MSLVAEFRVQSPELALEEALASVPEMELELIQEVGTDPERPYLFIWAFGDDFETFEAGMADDETVSHVDRYTELEDAVLYRMGITDAAGVVSYPVWVEVGAELLEARYTDGWWNVKMRFPDRETLSTVESWCTDVEMTFDLQCISTDDPGRDDKSTLTDPQREVLAVAYEKGYFEVPREASVEDIAAELGISGQAVSERLRRGHQKLVASHVVS
jgi:predicted DNA binding protein